MCVCWQRRRSAEGFKYKLASADAELIEREETVYPPSSKAGRGGRVQQGRSGVCESKVCFKVGFDFGNAGFCTLNMTVVRSTGYV